MNNEQDLKTRIEMLKELKDQQSYAVMKERALNRRRWKEFMPRTCQRQNTNDDDKIQVHGNQVKDQT